MQRPSYKRKTVIPAFRNWILEYFGVRPRTSECRFLHYLLLGKSRDESGLKVSRECCAELDGLDPHSYEARHIFVAENFLRRMQAAFPTLQLEWSDFSMVEGRVRTIRYQLPPDVIQAVEAELATLPPESERVYFVDGTQIDRRKRAAERQATLDYVRATNDARNEQANDDERLMFNYLNSLSSNHFSKLRARIGNAVEAVRQLPIEQQERELSILEAIELQPQQFYGFSERSTRLAILDNSIASLRSSIRKVLTQDWLEVDLRNAQLAINARLWDLPRIQAFLQTGQSWWVEMFDWFSVAPDPDFKDLMKKATYALCFGASKETLRNGNEDWEGLGTRVDRFFQHPSVDELWQGRQEMQRQVAQAGGHMDAYGHWVPIDRREQQYKHSVMAQVSQSYEQMLIAEVFKLAQTTDEFTVLLYQSDGVSLVFQDRRRRELWLRRIQEAVQTKANELGIQTELTA